jgi:phosphonate transport system substrate-binding protein
MDVPVRGDARRTALGVLLALSIAFLASACGDNEPAVRVDLSKRSEMVAPEPERSITYAYLPQYSHQTSYERHHQLVKYLREATGLPLRQVFPDTFDEHEKMVVRGEIDISFSNPFVYARMAKHGVNAFARIVEISGQPDFYSQIIIRTDNRAIRSVENSRGKRWIAVDPTSAGGYLFALGHFYEHGIRREDFAEIAFAPGLGGKQEKVVLAVYTGAYDLGSVRDGTLELLEDKIDLSQIRVLAESRRYPGWVYASRPGLDQEVVERIGKAMFDLSRDDPRHADILDAARFQEIIPARDSDFDPIRSLMDMVGLQ